MIGIGTRVTATVKGKQYTGTVVFEYYCHTTGEHSVTVRTDVTRYSPVTGRAYDGTLVAAEDVDVID